MANATYRCHGSSIIVSVTAQHYRASFSVRDVCHVKSDETAGDMQREEQLEDGSRRQDIERSAKCITSETCMMMGTRDSSFLILSCLHERPTTMAPPRYRSLLELAARRQPWTCQSCARTKPTPFFQSPPIRRLQTSQKARQDAAPTMEQMREPFKNKNTNTLYVKSSAHSRKRRFFGRSIEDKRQS